MNDCLFCQVHSLGDFFKLFKNVVSDTKAAVLRISKFYLNVLSIVIWEVIFHVTETLRRPSGPSACHCCIFLR